MKSVFSFRCHSTTGRVKKDVLLTFMATREFDETGLAEVIETETHNNLVPDEVLILVPDPLHTKALKLLKESSTLQGMKARLREAAIFLISYDQTGSQKQCVDVADQGRTPSISLDVIARRAITDIFKQRDGFRESSANYHFQNPSGRHTERFMRISNILVRGAEIAFIAFGSLRLVPEDATIAYIDTPALYGLVGAINEQIGYFDPGRQPLLADNFKSYPGVETYPFERIADSVVIISASSSGSLANLLRDKHLFSNEQIFHVVYLGTAAEKARTVCNLERDKDENPDGFDIEDVRSEPPDDCKLCAGGSRFIPLIGDQFDIGGPQPEPLLLTKNCAPPGLSGIFERYAGKSIFALGHGKSKTMQPSQFHVNEAELFASTDFQRRVDYLLDRTVPGQAKHVVCLNENSRWMAERTKSRCKTEPLMVGMKDLDSIPNDTKDPVVVVASVIESGRSLQDVSRDFRRVCPEAPIIYLVGLSKTTAESRRDSLSKTLTQTDKPIRHVYEFVEQIVLPSSETEHAWNRELGLLREETFKGFIDVNDTEARDIFRLRRERLELTSDPLVNDLFLTNRSGTQMHLQPGFVFWKDGWNSPSSQADVFFTVASILQRLRANSEDRSLKTKITSNWFQQTLLAPSNFGRFNDGVIQSSLLRAAKARELNYASSPEASSEMARIIKRVVESADKDRGEAASEFLLALATRQLRLAPKDMQEVMAIDETHAPPTVKVLLKACRSS